ncbi:hypothetical protein EUX98_g104 [Antrodiella citrinella]|uniref:Nudix hydrolase domain-containing protein n=1 Tax=Antrodiella citrinella TaxID=2447956 RepID=A0A4S4N4U0_9APHY|nr:hypothetical protein EUX98_g104 [Antrodiella citrinella]
MDGTAPGEPGVLSWCSMIRFTMAQDPGRAFLDQQIQQQGFDFLDNYLDNVFTRPKEESVYELLKTPSRKKATRKQPRHNNTTKVGPANIISLEDNVTEKENAVPVNSFHKALLDAKEQEHTVDTSSLSPEVSALLTPPQVVLNTAEEMQVSPAVSVEEGMQLDSRTPVADQSADTPEVEVRVVDEDMEASLAMHVDEDEDSEPLLAQELSVIAEDDEDRSRISPQPPSFAPDSPKDIMTHGREIDNVISNVPTLARKPSMSQFAGLPAPSPLRKSMKLTREHSSTIVAPNLAQTPAAALGGKRSSWLTKAKEVKALEMTVGKKSGESFVGMGALLSNKKRKSGEMLGQAENVTEQATDRKPKSAKFVEPAQSPLTQPQSLDPESLPESRTLKAAVGPPPLVRPSVSSTYQDDFTVALADLSEDEGALDKLKRTVEGFGARSKSMGKSLGGNAAAALAEARAAAQARVAERNKEEDTEVVIDGHSSPPAQGIASNNIPERRLSVSDLVTSSKGKGKASMDTDSSNKLADTSVSTTPPDSPRLPTRLSQAVAPPPVFSKPPPVFVAPPPVAPQATNLKEFSFKLPVGHPFSLPPAMALGVNSGMPSSGSSKVHPLSAQSSKASVQSDHIFDKEDDIPAWMPNTQDTQSSMPNTQEEEEKEEYPLDEDSWRVDENLKSSQIWTPFGLATSDKDDTMTWTTTTGRSTSQKGDTDRLQQIQNVTDALEGIPERGPFSFQPQHVEEEGQEDDLADMDIDVDDDDLPADSELEDLALAGKATISLVPQTGHRSQSQQSMASTSSSQSQQLGFFGQATKLMTSVLGGSKKTKAEPVKSIQRAAVVAKKQHEEAEKKATRLRDMEQRRQQALQRKAEEEKVRVQEEEKKLKDEIEKRKREREDTTEKRPLRSTTKKARFVTEEDTTKKRKLTVEPEKKVETKKPPSRDQPSRIGKAPAATPTTKTGPPLKSAMKQPSQSSLATGSSTVKDPAVKTVKTVASSSTLKSTSSSLKGKGKAEQMHMDDLDPAQVVHSQMANRVKAQIQAAQPPRVASESIELPEINSEYSDSDDEDRPKKFDPPSWAQSPELRQTLQQQSTMNPDDIFGQIRPLRMEEIFRTRTSRFRARTSSANWSGADQLTAEEEKAYEKRMGYRHWYYEDFIREEDTSLPTMTLKKFSSSLFNVCPFLKNFGHDHDQAFQSFLAYKTRVPVCGAIMLNETWDKCLLVKGWKATSAWGFPKGKINEQEPKFRCAIREVLEETGYDLDSRLDPSDMVEMVNSGQSISLFIVPNIPEDFPFATRTRKEISKISWFKLTDLPSWKRKGQQPASGKFYLVNPFILPLKQFIHDRKPRKTKQNGNAADPQSQVTGDAPPLHSNPPGPASTHSSEPDNTEPPTPSPQYSEPMVNHSDDSPHHMNGINGHAENVPPDSHLAFLLSSLTKSAKITPAFESSEETARPDTPRSRVLPASPAPASEPHNTRPARVVPPQSPPSVTHTVCPSPTPLQSSNPHRAPSPFVSSRSPVPQTTPQSATQGSGGVSPVSPRTTRRNPGLSTDISPYFTRAAPAAIPKQMKYLTMLENIARESERMTPKLERQMQVMDNMLRSNPPNVPMYQAHTGAGIAAPHATHPLGPGGPVGPNFPTGFMPNPLQHDPFTVRSRTSNNFHHAPFSHMPRASMNEEQLRFMMAGVSPRNQFAPAARPFGQLHQLPHQPHHLGFPPGHPAGPPPPSYQQPPPQLTQHQYPQQQSLRVIPPQYLSNTLSESGPLTAPPISPTYNLASRPNPANAHLLSILNAPGIPRAVTTAPSATMGSHA